MKAWWLAIRPKTLTAAVVPIFVGTALAVAQNREWHGWIVIATLLASFAIQIATNLFNDVIDFKKGADRNDRKGPQRVTQGGLITPEKVTLLACGLLLVAVVLGFPLVWRGGWSIVGIGVLSLFLAYSYTGGPFPLAYLGLGDLFVVLFFGVISVAGVFYLHTLTFSWGSVLAGLQVGFWATVLLAINNLRDVDEDRRAAKKTLAVRFGKKFARFEIGFLIFGSFALGVHWVLEKAYWAGVLPLILLPVSLQLFLQIKSSPPSQKFNGYLARAAFLHLLFGLNLSLGLWLS